MPKFVELDSSINVGRSSVDLQHNALRLCIKVAQNIRLIYWRFIEFLIELTLFLSLVAFVYFTIIKSRGAKESKSEMLSLTLPKLQHLQS